MTDTFDEQRLTDLLERTADRTPVGPAPLLALRAGAARSRRRRAAGAVLGSAPAVAAVVAGTTLLPDRPSTTGPVLTPAPTSEAADPADPDVSPPGMRLVGVRRLAVAVPDDWSVNATQCGIPMENTVIVDQAVVPSCGLARSPAVDSVQVEPVTRRDLRPAGVSIDLDGTPAWRTPVSCTPGAGDREVCRATLSAPEAGGSITAASPDRATVERLLDSIRLLEDTVGVPALSYVQVRRQERSGEAYVRLLQEAGLRAEVTEAADDRRWPPGFVVSADPAPGSVVPLGSTVRVAISGGR